MSKSAPQSASRSRFVLLLTAALLASFVLALQLFRARPVQAVSTGVVISQIYGGAGCGTVGCSTYKNDYIEVFNRGTSPVSLNGWSVQYASAAGTTWQVTNLTNFTLQPGQYYLVQEGAGANGINNIPTPDATGTIAMSATTAKVALVNSTTALSGACPSGASIVDFIGYGSSATCFETAVAPAPSTANADIRNGGGCTETDNNSTDFSALPANPRNSTSATHSCGASTNPSGVGAANPSTVPAGNITLLTVTVTPGTNPTSTGLAVSGNLSTIGGSATQQFFDDGTHGDLLAGNNVFSFQATVSPATSTGAKSLPATITDAQSRSGSASIALTVTAASTAPTGTGSASPNSLQAGNSTLLTVNVTNGTNPTSTGLSVTGDLSSIGGSGSQQFFDNGTNGDVTGGDNIFSFQATVSVSTTPGAKSLPITITDAQARSSSTSISLTVQPPPPPTTIKVSQVYGGGGNSGSTYKNDFIEIFNQGPTTIDVTNWSVQYNSAGATGTWQVTNLCPVASTCTVAPGHYYLVQESQGAGGTTPLPTPDATGVITMSATSAKVALVASTAALTGCPTGGALVDLVGYSPSANCYEMSPTTSNLSATTAAVRRGNGCIDTDNNASDFVTIGPIPRNSASPVNSCGGDPTQPSGLGIASPASVDPASTSLLTVNVTPATTPPSTNLGVSGDLTSIGGFASQQFYDDGTNGDNTAGDNIFSYRATVGAFITTGVKNIVTTITDAQARTATAPITMTVQSPTCGVERWSVKTGTDPDAGTVDLNNPVHTTVADLGSIPAPPDPPGPPLNARLAPTETTVYVVNATMLSFKKENDVDYHIVLQDDTGHTMIAEIPCPCCVGLSSPFTAGIANARSKFDARFTPTSFFQNVNIPVQITGVGFFDFIHGQTGVAPNGIELHPVLDISFTANTSTTLMSDANPSQYGQSVGITATVTNGGISTPTGTVNFFDNGSPLGSRTLDVNGHATFNTNTLSVGSHPITASYEGDSMSATSTSAVLMQVVNQADQTINFGALAGKTYGDADFMVSATASSGLAVSFSILSGPATISGNTVHITGAGTVTVQASQGGDDNYNPAPDADQSFEVAKAGQTITFAALSDKTYGDPPFTVSGTGGDSGNPVTFGASGNCTSSGTNGSTITITGGGSCTVTASQAGAVNYDPAADVPRAFTINQATASITVNGYNDVYDGNAHGASGSATGINNEDLNSLLNLGATFTDVPGGTAHWTFAGNANYAPASGDAAITITQATATISVNGYTGVYDGSAHGGTGSATGVKGENLTVLLNLGATFTDVPGGTAHWTFAGNTDYASAGGDATITINRATPSFSNLSSPVITLGTASTALSGQIGSLIPTGNVSITLNSVTQSAPIQAGGNFSSNFATGALAASSYSIAYSYGGDNNFNSASGTGTLKVGYNIMPLYDQTKVANSGSTIPIKLEITDANGNNLSSANTVVTAVRLALVSTNVYGPVEDSGNANPDSNFRFAGDSYIFNLKTTGLATGVYNLYFEVGNDPTLHTVQFQIK